MKYWTKKKRHVSIYMKTLYIKLDKKTFNKVWKRRLQKEWEIIDKSKSLTFLKNCVVGKITKEDLDDERVREINKMDMMSNSSIIWHQESINELQIICLSLFTFFYKSLNIGDFTDATVQFNQEKPLGLVYCLLVYHFI